MIKVTKKDGEIYVKVSPMKILVALFIAAVLFIIIAEAGVALDRSFSNQDRLIENHKMSLKYGYQHNSTPSGANER